MARAIHATSFYNPQFDELTAEPHPRSSLEPTVICEKLKSINDHDQQQLNTIANHWLAQPNFIMLTENMSRPVYIGKGDVQTRFRDHRNDKKKYPEPGTEPNKVVILGELRGINPGQEGDRHSKMLAYLERRIIDHARGMNMKLINPVATGADGGKGSYGGNDSDELYVYACY